MNTEVNLMNSKYNNLIVANTMFMLLAFLFIGGSFVMNAVDTSFKLSIVIIQYGIVLLPILIVMKLTGVDIRSQFRMNRISFKTAIQSILITLFSLPIAYTLNFIMNYILIKLDLFQVQTMEVGSGTFNFFIMIFLIAITPGICEEVFFRGMMFSAFREKINPHHAILITGLFFGLFHFNLQNLMLPSFLGIIFAYLVYYTNSIYSSMIGHTLFNFIGLIIMYNDTSASDEELDMAISFIDEAGLQAMGIFLVVSLISASILFALFKWLIGKPKLEVGQVIHLKHKSMVIKSVNEVYIEVLVDDTLQTIMIDKLNSLNYKIAKSQESYPGLKLINLLPISMVIILYIAFMVLIYA